MLRRLFLIAFVWAMARTLMPDNGYGPKFAATVNGVRRYRNPNRHDNGYVYRSVTNVTGALPKPALIRWAAKITAETAVEQLEAWSNMPPYEAVDWLKQTPYRNRDRAAARGTTIHAVIDNILQGRTYEVESLVEPWVGAAMRFIQDARPRVERTEASVYNEKVLTAGTFDFLGRLDRAPELGRVLIDWKTSKGVYADMAVQVVGGYALGTDYILDDDGKEQEWHEPDTVLIVHFSAEGYSIRPVPKDRTLRRAFLGALEIRKWEDDGPPIGQPYQLQLDLDGPAFANTPSDAELAHVKSRLVNLDEAKRWALQQQCIELGIEVRLKHMTVTDLDRLLGLIKLYEMGEPITGHEGAVEPTPEDHSEPRRPRRPMP
jgi:hypothetical protein